MDRTSDNDWSEFATGLGPVRPIELGVAHRKADSAEKLRALLRTNLLYWRRQPKRLPATGMEVVAEHLTGQKVPV